MAKITRDCGERLHKIRNQGQNSGLFLFIYVCILGKMGKIDRLLAPQKSSFSFDFAYSISSGHNKMMYIKLISSGTQHLMTVDETAVAVSQMHNDKM